MLVLFDVDKTLIDREYHLTDPGLPAAIERAIVCGHTIGLNSDTPIAALLCLHKELGMNGPIIAERGAVVWIEGSIYPTGTAPSGIFSSVRDRILSQLTSVWGFDAILGDPTRTIRTCAYQTREERRVVLASALRSFSLHLVAQRIHFDSYTRDEELFTRIEAIARVEAAKAFPGMALDWDVNQEYGILILHSAESRKHSGVKKLMELTGLKSAIMVGDSLFDDVNLPGAGRWKSPPRVADLDVDVPVGARRVPSVAGARFVRHVDRAL
jgi:hypothetical protein